MLEFVLGRAGSGKTEHLRRMLAQKSLAGEEKLIMIVPEQYTFETEKAMLRLCGAERANNIQVYSFTRLAEAVFRKEGGAAGRRLSDGGRRILMSSALMECEDQLEVYQNAAKSGRVTDIMLTAVNEMKMCGITPQQLADTARIIDGRGLRKKLSEIALLYGAFEALVAASYLDSRDDLTRLEEALQVSEFFRDATVAVDSFEGFTVQETAVLAQILKKADTVSVALCTDGTDQQDTGLFALVERTRSNLTRVAEDNGVKLATPVMLTGAPRFKNENLKLIEAQLFCAEETLTSPDNDGVEVFEARDVYEEAEFVAATIRRLVEEKGWRYRDFSIICRTPDPYYGSLDVALKKRGIPCFVSAPSRVDAEPVMRFVLGAFKTVQSGFATGDLLEMLKTGLSGFTAEEISDLENYAFLWSVTGSAWRDDFVRHPRGFGKEMADRDREELERLNTLRKRLMLPLLRFAAATKDASGAEISQAVFDMLTDFGMEKNLPDYCRELENTGEDGLAAKQLRVWDLLMELLDQMHSILGSKKTPRDRYYRLLKEVVSAEDVSEIPQTIDEVIFGTAEQVRQSSPKAAFLIGAAQGDFPLIPKSSGVFSDAERRELINLKLPLGDPLEQKTIEERYLAYSVACAPSEMLYVCWHRTSGGEDKEPGELVTAVRSIFQTLVPVVNLPDEYFANSKEAAFSRMAARFKENTPQAAAMREIFKADPDYTGRIEALERSAGQRPDRIESPELAHKIFGENMFISPTQIENFHSCPFKYFCRFGLNAKERRPAEVDVMQYGTLMHYIFENMFRLPPEELLAYSDEKLLADIKELILTYAEENMGGIGLFSGREKYRLDRMALSARRLVRHVAQELSQSQFKPKHFELNLGTAPEFPPLKIEDGEGGLITVGGTIDRVDMFERDGKEYVRVIDYKTGKKEFKLIDVLYGLNMQMLVYLAALVESGEHSAAGILYVPAAEPSVSVERTDTEAQIEQKAESKLRMNGMLLKNKDIICAMEDGARGRFVPAALTKDGRFDMRSSVISSGSLDVVLEYSKGLIAAMGRELRHGCVEAAPNMINASACKYCPYSAVCGKEFTDEDIVKKSAKADDIIQTMCELQNLTLRKEDDEDA